MYVIIDWCSCQFSSRVFGVIVVTISAGIAACSANWWGRSVAVPSPKLRVHVSNASSCGSPLARILMFSIIFTTWKWCHRVLVCDSFVELEEGRQLGVTLPLPNRRVEALRARTAAIYRTKEVPHTLPIFSRSRVIVDHHMSICQTGRPVAWAQCASRFAHWTAIQRTKEVPQARTARRHDPQSRGLLKFYNRYNIQTDILHVYMCFIVVVITIATA